MKYQISGLKDSEIIDNYEFVKVDEKDQIRVTYADGTTKEFPVDLLLSIEKEWENQRKQYLNFLAKQEKPYRKEAKRIVKEQQSVLKLALGVNAVSILAIGASTVLIPGTGTIIGTALAVTDLGFVGNMGNRVRRLSRTREKLDEIRKVKFYLENIGKFEVYNSSINLDEKEPITEDSLKNYTLEELRQILIDFNKEMVRIDRKRKDTLYIEEREDIELPKKEGKVLAFVRKSPYDDKK